jgi:ketosteroid isomerase-like protein
VTEHPNAERVRRGFEAFAAGDLSAVAELVAPDCIWRIRGASALAGEYHGRDAILALLRRTAELSGATYRVEPRWVAASDEQLVVVYRATGRRDARTLDLEQALVCRLADGLLVEVDALPFDQYAFDAFWS